MYKDVIYNNIQSREGGGRCCLGPEVVYAIEAKLGSI